MAPKVLFVLTSQDALGNTGKKTGWFLPEFAHPYNKIAPKAECVIASPAGGEAPLDQGSVQMFKDDAESMAFLKEKSDLWQNTQKLDSFLGRSGEFAAIFFVGGHGPMFDLATNPQSQQLIREFYEAGKVTSAVCHGPAALANVKLADGSYLVKGQEVTGFTNAEEDQSGMTEHMPFLLETQLEKNGATFSKAADPWGVKIVVSGKGKKLLTGQNPASAGPLGEVIAAML